MPEAAQTLLGLGLRHCIKPSRHTLDRSPFLQTQLHTARWVASCRQVRSVRAMTKTRCKSMADVAHKCALTRTSERVLLRRHQPINDSSFLIMFRTLSLRATSRALSPLASTRYGSTFLATWLSTHDGVRRLRLDRARRRSRDPLCESGYDQYAPTEPTRGA